MKFISHQPSFLLHFLTFFFFPTYTMAWESSFSWTLSVLSQIVSMGSCLEYRFMSFRFSAFALSLHASVMLTLSFDKVCRGNPTRNMIKRSFITGFHIFLVVPSWSVFIVAFYIESVWIYSPCYFLHLNMISAFWMMLLIITALQSCWIFFCSSLHCFICCLLPCD